MKNPINNIITISKVLFLFIILNCISCTNTKSYEPSIIYNQTDTNCEVRLTLPNGESKVILKVDEKITKTGVKNSFISEKPSTDGNESFLKGDTSYHIINTSYAIINTDSGYLFYIYTNKKKVIVYREKYGISGYEDMGIIFESEIDKIVGDKIQSKQPTKFNNQNITQNEKIGILYFERRFGTNDNQKSVYKLSFKGDNVEISYQYADYEPIIEHGIYKDGNLIVNGCLDCYTLNNEQLCIPNPETGELDCYDFNYSKSTCKIEDLSCPSNSNTINGQKLKSDERLVKFNWGMENPTSLTRDMDANSRFASKTLKVPNGKVWILLHVDDYYYYENDRVVQVVPYLSVNKEIIDWSYKRKFSEKQNIDLSRAKIENLIFYPNETIKTISNYRKGEAFRGDFYDFKGEIWFLELNSTKEFENDRMKYELKVLKEENRQNQRNLEALQRAERLRRWQEDAQNKMNILAR